MGISEYDCRRCGKHFSLENSRRLQYCSACGTVLAPRPPPRHWIFQFNPGTYRWFDRIRQTNEPEQWLTSQHSRFICKGDLVAIWSSGGKSGVYAIGEVVTPPKKAPLNPEQQQFYTDKVDIGKFQEKPSVMVKYSQILLDGPILYEKCKDDPILFEMEIFMNPQGTNFRLGNEQWLRICSLAEKET